MVARIRAEETAVAIGLVTAALLLGKIAAQVLFHRSIVDSTQESR